MKTLLELSERDCKWPVGEPPEGQAADQLFCALRRVPGKPYCTGCCALAYDPDSDKAHAHTAKWVVRLAA